LSELPPALYEPVPGALAATELTRGPWNPDHQHAGPPAALLAREIERTGRIEGGQVGRLSFDILRPVPIATLEVSARVLRPGRSVEQVEAELRLAGGDEVLMRATAWRVRRTADRRPQTAGSAAPPPPETGEPGRFGFWTDDVAYKDALDWRFVGGEFETPGPATAWTRLLVPLVAGEEPAPLERLLVMADAASGISAALDWGSWMFVNVDLGIHLARPPSGEWMAMAARTDIGPSGMGLCTSTLYDGEGAVGVSTQTLLVAPR
jgi:Thioesterase-like superfamily